MKRRISVLIVLLLSIMIVTGAKKKKKSKKPAKPVLIKEWVAKIKDLAPEKAGVEPKAKRKVVCFSLTTGFNHYVIPFVDEVLKILADKTGAYEITITKDGKIFEKENLRKYDAVILNNNCSMREHRDMFMDILVTAADKYGKSFTDLSVEVRQKKANELEKNLIDYVRNGKGLMAIHGAIVMQNNSKAFSEMLGGSFDFHPKNQEVTINIVEPGHPLVKAFDGKSFIHKDEPYLFKNAYIEKKFRPLLVMDTEKLVLKENQAERVKSDIRYVSSIKKHGRGRVFYMSPSHNHQSYEDARMLQFYLDGLQYVLGDLQCDDTAKF